jgi:D-alanyl-D-alanine carboxypeptidase (penicillin-binding protein 5/6)
MSAYRLLLAALLSGACVLGLVAAPAAAVTAAPTDSLTDTAATVVGGERLGVRGLQVQRAAGVPRPPKVTAKAFVVADAGTGAVLAARNAHLRLPPASTLKTLTALTVLPKLDPATVYTATPDDANVEGSKAGIVPKGTYTVHELMQALFLRSGNDAATALAHANGGVEATVAEMNALAQHLGALDTFAVNPTGLDEDAQLSSAYDLALLGRAALAVPALVDYASTISSVFPGKPARKGRKRPTFELWTQQKFVLNYDGALGIKNGYTTNARNTLIAAAERDGRHLVVTLMGGGSGAWREAVALSDWAFAHAASLTPVGDLVEPGSLASDGGTGLSVDEAATGGGGPDDTEVLAARVRGLPADEADEADGASFLRIVLTTLAVLFGVVALLRARVLLRQRRRRLAYRR